MFTNETSLEVMISVIRGSSYFNACPVPFTTNTGKPCFSPKETNEELSIKRSSSPMTAQATSVDVLTKARASGVGVSNT